MLNRVIWSELASGLGIDRQEELIVGCAGHSLGEYSAIAASNAAELEALSEVVLVRAVEMAKAALQQPGTMAAIMANRAQVEELIEQTSIADVWVANLNSTSQSVVSGSLEGIEELVSAAKSQSIKALRFPVGGAFHTPFMAPALPQLAEALGKIKWSSPRFPVVTNFGAQVFGRNIDPVFGGRIEPISASLDDPDPDPDPASRCEFDWTRTLLDQLVNPVRWFESVEVLVGELGANTLVEVGPGNVLTSLARRAHPDVNRFQISKPSDIREFVSAIAE